jgi:plasmid stabilization system protein ParE
VEVNSDECDNDIFDKVLDAGKVHFQVDAAERLVEAVAARFQCQSVRARVRTRVKERQPIGVNGEALPHLSRDALQWHAGRADEVACVAVLHQPHQADGHQPRSSRRWKTRFARGSSTLTTCGRKYA